MYLIFASGKIQHLRSPFEPPSHVDSGRADPAREGWLFWGKDILRTSP